MNKEEIRCLKCLFGSKTSIGSLYCSKLGYVLLMQPENLLPCHNGYVRAFRVKKQIDECINYKVKPK